MGRSRVSEADPLRRRGGHQRTKKNDTGNNSGKTGFDGFAQAPWRKTVSIFKQPVTLVHTTRSRDNKKPTTEQLKRGTGGKQYKPVQLLWSKALEGMDAVIPIEVADKAECQGEAIHSRLELAHGLHPALPAVTVEAASASLCCAMHNPLGTAVIGQKADSKILEANMKGNIDCEQALVTVFTVGEEDVKNQERRVIDARKRLQEIRKHFFT